LPVSFSRKNPLKNKPRIVVVIPAYNEEKSIVKVLQDMPMDWVDEVVVVDNNSTDETYEVAKQNGATVLKESFQGYGSACLKGIAYYQAQNPQPGILVFMDADYSDHPEELPSLIQPIFDKDIDMVIGSRALGNREKGSMTIPQIIGNKIASILLRLIYKVHFTDLGPFRAVKFDALMEIQMCDKTYGWTVEMQLKAAKLKMKTCEVPVTYRRRIGVSKVSGTMKGAIMAGYKIIATIFKYR
jgi:glycosyltransferase involved in cell wall biosynthesis